MSNKKELILKNLQKILGNDADANILEYLINIQETDFEEFFENIVDKENKQHIAAYSDIKSILFGNKNQTKPKNQPQSTQQVQSRKEPHSKKEKKKFKDINEFQQQKKKKEGRSACDCMGQEHDFLNNCINCGRIHCENEGPGPCLFCGSVINFRGAFDTNARQKGGKAKESRVFDDDKDYFKMNSKTKNKEDAQKMVIALDLATRRVIEGTKEDAKIREQLLTNSMQHLKKIEKIFENLQQQQSQQQSPKNSANDELIELLIQMRHKKPQGVEDLGPEDDKMPIIDYGLKVFDEDLMPNVDHGLCLSMHQPYASLLVAGVKKHEGRTWPTTHRGRLWIAAAAKQPDEDEIVALENFYKEYYQDTTIKFPKVYPTSVLLGCVNVEDCMDQESYRKKFPNGESDSPFVLICSNPIILPIFYSIVGKHKIYPLDKEMHKCAKIALQHAKYV